MSPLLIFAPLVTCGCVCIKKTFIILLKYPPVVVFNGLMENDF